MRPVVPTIVVAIALSASPPAALQRALPRNGADPTVEWRVNGEGHGRPATDGQTVYFLSSQHEVTARDAATGVLRWTASTGEPGSSTFGSAVTIAGSVVVAGDYNLIAFDRATGDFRWRFVPTLGYGPGVYLGQSTEALVLAGSPAGRLYALYATTGDLSWTADIGNAITTIFQPVTDGRVVAATYTTFTAPNRGGVLLLDLGTGRQIWRREFPIASDPLIGTGAGGGPLIVGDRIIAASGAGTVYGLRRSDGALAWTLPGIAEVPDIIRGPLPVPQTAEHADFRPLAHNLRNLFVGSLTGAIVAYDLNTQRERWRHWDQSSGSVNFAITCDESLVYVPFFSGRHVALDASIGVERWHMGDAASGFFWPAISDANRVYLAGASGGFVALRR